MVVPLFLISTVAFAANPHSGGAPGQPGKTCGTGTYNDLINCIPFLGNTSFGLGITCSEGWYGYTGALPGYNTADYYSPETGLTIVAWINYQANEPVEGIASVMVRDIARILTPDHIPFVYKEGSESSNR